MKISDSKTSRPIRIIRFLEHDSLVLSCNEPKDGFASALSQWSKNKRAAPCETPHRAARCIHPFFLVKTECRRPPVPSTSSSVPWVRHSASVPPAHQSPASWSVSPTVSLPSQSASPPPHHPHHPAPATVHHHSSDRGI